MLQTSVQLNSLVRTYHHIFPNDSSMEKLHMILKVAGIDAAVDVRLVVWMSLSSEEPQGFGL